MNKITRNGLSAIVGLAVAGMTLGNVNCRQIKEETKDTPAIADATYDEEIRPYNPQDMLPNRDITKEELQMGVGCGDISDLFRGENDEIIFQCSNGDRVVYAPPSYAGPRPKAENLSGNKSRYWQKLEEAAGCKLRDWYFDSFDGSGIAIICDNLGAWGYKRKE
ncbi:MAG: hypothetical protein V1734_06350 [Nanoarchaeota archaeon]